MEYDKDTVENLYKENLSDAQQRLASLPVAEGREPTTKGLNGWVYEQTIRYCLSQELTALGISSTIEEQKKLYGRIKIDLWVGRVAIEIKLRGSFGDDARKYSKYRPKVLDRGWIYCYLTGSEEYGPYRSAIESTFGKERAFFLSTEGDWERFVREVMENY